MMDSINPNAPKTKDYIQMARNENQKERIAPYKPSIDKKLSALFETSIPNKKELPIKTVVDWSFLDKDDGKPGELPDWAKRQVKRLERLRDKDETTNQMIEDTIQTHKFTRNIPPPSIPKKYNPNDLIDDSWKSFGTIEDNFDFEDDENIEP